MKLFLLVLFFPLIVFSQENKTIPKIEHPEVFPAIYTDPNPVINDWENDFNYKQYKRLTKIIYTFYGQTNISIRIVTVDSIAPYNDIQKYATDFGNFYGVGDSEKDTRITLALSKNLSQVGIATGLGIENSLTNEICKKIIEQDINPYFKKAKYYKGIKIGLLELIENLE